MTNPTHAAGRRLPTVDGPRDEAIDLRYKGFAPTVPDGSVTEMLARRPRLLDAGFSFPLLALDEAALRHNATTMADFCQRKGVHLAPHGKTTMSPELHALQRQAGAWGLTAATIHQVAVYRAFGVDRILLANELVDELGVRWVTEETAADPDFSFYCYADSVAGVELIGQAIRTHSPSRPLQILVEVGYPGGRGGCRDLRQVLEVAGAIVADPGLSLAGVGGYEGLLGHDLEPATVIAVRSFVSSVRDAASAVLDSGTYHGAPGDFIVTCGGSAYFDIVVDELVDGWRRSEEVTVVLRAGSYLTHDEGLYADVSPFARLLPRGEDLRPALQLWAHVLSTPDPCRAIVGAGRRDVPFDAGLPQPRLLWSRGDDEPRTLTGATTIGLDDHHSYVELEQDGEVAVGDLVMFGISHPCTAFDKWRLIPVLDDGWNIVDCVHTCF